MKMLRIKFHGKVPPACASEPGRYSMNGAKVLIEKGETEGMALTTDGRQLAVSTVETDQPCPQAIDEIIPRDAIPNWADGWCPRITEKSGQPPVYLAKGEFVGPAESPVYPNIHDVTPADLPERSLLLGVNPTLLINALAAAARPGCRVVMVLDLNHVKPGEAFAHPVQIVALDEDARPTGGIAVLMPVKANFDLVRRHWLTVRAALGTLMAKVAGVTTDGAGALAAQRLAALDKAEMEEAKAAAKAETESDDAQPRRKARRKVRNASADAEQPKALPAPGSATAAPAAPATADAEPP